MHNYPALNSAETGPLNFRSVVQTLSEPLIIIDVHRRVCFANLAAETALKRIEGLSLHGGMLAAEGRDLQARLGRAIVDAVAAPGVACSVLLDPQSDGSCAVLHLSVLADADNATPNFPTQLIAKICLSVVSREPDLHAARQTFGLSQTEAEIALQISAGLSPRRIALRRDSSEETVRWHIKNIFSKTYTSRLVDLALQLSAARSPFVAEHPVPHAVAMHRVPVRHPAHR